MALLGGFFGVLIGFALAETVTLLLGFPSTVKCGAYCWGW
jgi:hypothetical protein